VWGQRWVSITHKRTKYKTMKYKLEITFNDYTTEEYYSNHLNINGLMSSEHVRDINIINITHYENKSKRVN
jgi:hypothetical protein